MAEEKNRLYVGNLPFTVDEAELKKLFEAAGEVEETAVITDKASGRSRGFGFVTMKDEKSAEKAVKEMNEKEIEGRPLKVDIARPMRRDE